LKVADDFADGVSSSGFHSAVDVANYLINSVVDSILKGGSDTLCVLQGLVYSILYPLEQAVEGRTSGDLKSDTTYV
jgi:hypothetical protein